MGAEGAQRSAGTKGTRRKCLSILHHNTILKPNPNPNAHPNPKPSPNPTPSPQLRLNIGTERVEEGISAHFKGFLELA